MAWKVTFKNNKEQYCEVFIKNGKNDTDTTGTPLVPDADPVHLQMEDDDDIFKPVRLTSGNINIKCDDFSVIRSIIASNPLDRPVTLTINNQVAWKGFVKCETFDQTLFGCNETFSIPVMCCLSALKGILVDDTNWVNKIDNTWVQNQPMDTVLERMNNLLGNPYTLVIYPASQLYANYVNKLNYIEELDTEDIDNSIGAKLYKGKSYLEMLEDIMYFCCSCAITYGSQLWFTPLYNSNFRLSDGGELSALPFVTTDHKVSAVLGKKSVKVTANANLQSGSVISFDQIVKRLKFTSSVLGEAKYLGGEGFLDLFECRLEDKDNVFINATSWLATNKTVINDSTTYAAAIEYEGRNRREGNDTTKSPSKFDFLSPAIILRNDMDDRNFNGANVRFNVPLPQQIADCPKYKVSFTIQTKEDKEDEWRNETCKCYVQNSYESGWVTKECKDGKFEENYPANLTYFMIGAYDPDNDWKYARITAFKIDRSFEYDDSYGIDAFDDQDSFECEKQIGKGFEDEYSISMNLASARTSNSNIPGSSTTHRLYGRGMCSNIYSTDIVHMEENLCGWAYEYYLQSRVRLSVTIDSNTYLPFGYYYTYNNKRFSIIAQELNVRDCELKLTLQECLNLIS